MSAEELEQTSFTALDDDEKVEETTTPVTTTPEVPATITPVVETVADVVEEKPKAVVTPVVASTSPTTTTTSTPKVAATTTPTSTPTATPVKRSSKGQPLPFSINPTDQTPVEQLSLADILMWRNIFVTVPVFLAIQALFLLLCKYEFTLVNLIGKVVFIQVLISVGYMVVFKIIQNNPK